MTTRGYYPIGSKQIHVSAKHKSQWRIVVVVRIGTQRASATILVPTLGTVLCSAPFSNGDNKRPQSRYAKSHRDLHHLHKSDLFNNNLRPMRETDQKNGNLSIARRPKLVLNINRTYRGKALGNIELNPLSLKSVFAESQKTHYGAKIFTTFCWPSNLLV